MTINITPEVGVAYAAYLDEQVDAFMDGKPIPRRATYPFVGDDFCGLIDFAAGFQAALARHRADNASLVSNEKESDTALLRQCLEALSEERRVRLLGQEPDVHWESMRHMRRACYAATDATLAKLRERLS